MQLKTLFFFFVILGSSFVNLSAQEEVENLIKDAYSYNKAYLDQDFNTVIDYTISSVVELAGGKEEMNKVAVEQQETLKKSGIGMVSITPGSPGELVKSDAYTHAILPQSVVIQVADTKFKRIVYYLATSDDDGKSWKFLDLEAYDADSIQEFVPSFPDGLAIPTPNEMSVVE